MTYDVEVAVIDSTESNYTVSWTYTNFKTNSPNPMVQKLTAVSDDISIDIKLDALGVLVGVENWEEVRDYMAQSFDTLRAEFPKSPEIDNMFQQLEVMYSSKASVEATSIQDAQQFHNFHGAKYTLNEELTFQMLTSNVHNPEKPFDTDVSVELEKLDKANNQYTIRSVTEVNAEQLTEATYEYMSKIVGNAKDAIIKREDFTNVSNIVETVSRIHNTGWVLESVLWKEVESDGVTNKEIRTIQLTK